MNEGKSHLEVSESEWREIVADAQESSVEILRRMVSFDTETATYSEPPHEDAAHQEFVADHLRDLGAEVTLFEPAPEEFGHHRMALPSQSFEGRPVLWAEFDGGPGRSLLFNGHYDTVPAGPLDAWTDDPRSGAISDGRIYGRGTIDMKGGIAAALAATGALIRAGVRPGGAVYFNVVPFEEHNGMGTTATMLRGYRADAAICCEPSSMRPLTASHGCLGLKIQVEGRSAHCEFPQPHHSLGGGVNAIDKIFVLLAEIGRMRDEWQVDPAKQHPYLAPPNAVTGLIEGGEFWGSYPAHAQASLDLTYQPTEADADGYGSGVRAEVERRMAIAVSLDSWLAEHPPILDWFVEYPPAGIDSSEPIVAAATAAATAVSDSPVIPGGFESWGDQAMLIKEGGIPTVLMGPGAFERAHISDEFITVEELHQGASGYVDLLRRWWGNPSG